MKNGCCWLISFLLTVVLWGFVLGVFNVCTVRHALVLMESNLSWMMFIIRIYLRLSMNWARFCVFFLFSSINASFYWLVAKAFALVSVQGSGEALTQTDPVLAFNAKHM